MSKHKSFKCKLVFDVNCVPSISLSHKEVFEWTIGLCNLIPLGWHWFQQLEFEEKMIDKDEFNKVT